MANAIIVIVLSSVLVAGGRKIMLHERHSRIEGLLSFAIGLSLMTTWYVDFPDDFAALGDGMLSALQRVLGHGYAAEFALAMILPVGLGFGLMMLVYKFEGRDKLGAVKNVIGPMPRMRRPKVLR